jgi:hypothetical protein
MSKQAITDYHLEDLGHIKAIEVLILGMLSIL